MSKLGSNLVRGALIAVLLLAAAGPASAAPPTPTYGWQWLEASGTVSPTYGALSMSVYGGAQRIAGVDGYGGQAVSNNQYFATSTSISLPTNVSVSVSGWISVPYISGTQAVYGLGTVVRQFISAGRYRVGLQKSDTTYSYFDHPTALPVNTWFHIAMAYDGSTNALQMWVNGVLSETVLSGSLRSTTVAATVQGNSAGSGTSHADEYFVWIGNVITSDDVACAYALDLVCAPATPSPTATPAASLLSLNPAPMFDAMSVVINGLWNLLAIIGGITVGVGLTRLIARAVGKAL